MNAYKSSTSNDQSLPNFIDSQNLPPFLCPLCRSASPTISEIFLEKKTNIPCISYKCKCSKNPQKETQIVSRLDRLREIRFSQLSSVES